MTTSIDSQPRGFRVWSSTPAKTCAGGLACLLALRWLTPAESVLLGESLWLCVLSLALAGIAAFSGLLRHESRLPVDFAILLLVGGHVISGMAVLQTSGNKRAALDMTWEWLGVGATWLLMRGLLCGRHRVHHRNMLLQILLSLTIVTAGFGLWQHFVKLPTDAARYGAMIDELTELNSGRPDSPMQAAKRGQRAQRIEAELASAGFPPPGPARELFIARLRASVEPFGHFALANTFGGCLALFLFPMLGCATMAWRRRGVPGAAVCFVGVLLIAYCLLLTKSRTAWIGVIVGSGLTLWRWRRQATDVRPIKRWLLSGCILVSSLVGIAVASGGLDYQVLSEAWKSVRYRLEYWQAGSQAVLESPLLGTGPGNFRQAYLKYKLPQSSEEIADPHNLLLDAWANGGLVGLTGIALLLLLLFLRTVDSDSATDGEQAASEPSTRPVLLGALAAFLVLYVRDNWNFGGGDQWLLLLLAFSVVFLILRHLADASVDRDWLQAGAVAMGVHLLGAGGLGMPGVVELWLFCVVVSYADFGIAAAGHPERLANRMTAWSQSLCAIGLAVGCIVTSFIPNYSRTQWMMTAGYESARGPSRRSLTALDNAIAADRLSPGAYDLKARVQYGLWMQGNRAGDFDAAIQNWLQAWKRDPLSSQIPRQLGIAWFQHFQDTEQPSSLQESLRFYRAAHAAYPTEPLLLSELAEVAIAANDSSARDYVEKTIILDDLNRKQGHRDRYLPDEVREALTDWLQSQTAT